MAEGLQAGRLDVPVVADLSGFAQKLRAEVEAAAKGLAAQIKVKVDDKNLRKKLKKAVEEASKGVTATVRVKVDENRFRTELDNLRRQLGQADLNLPVRADGDGSTNNRGGLVASVRRLITGAQDEAERRPVNVPVRMGLPGRGLSLRALGIGSIISLLEPAVALIGQYGAGLTALVSAAAPAVGVLGAIPGLITAAGTAVIGTKVAFSGFSDALGETLKIQKQQAAGTKVTKAEQEKLDQALQGLSKSARETVTEVAGLAGAWSKVKKSVSERFFSKIAGDVKPLATSVFPLLKSALGDSAAQLGDLADRGAKFMKSGIFQKDFKTIAGTNSRVLRSVTNGLANLGHTTEDFLVASGPFVERIGRAGEKFTQWVRASVKAGRDTGSLATFLDHAGDKAAQLGRATGSLIKGLGGVGKAAMDTGNAMLDGFEGAMKRFERYATSGAGQKAMKAFFADAAPAFHEVNLLFGDLMRGLGRSMKDGGITDLVRQIRLELVPALGTFFSSLGKDVGPAVLSVISNIATALGNLSAAGSGLGVLLAAFNGLLQIVNGITRAVPGLNTALAVTLGTMLALKVVGGVTTMLRNFGTSVTAAGTSARTLGTTLRGQLGAGVMGPQISGWQRISLAYQGAARQGNVLTGTLRGIRAANGAATRALGGLTSAFGGPLGLAITGVTIGLGLLATKQEAAARAAQAHKERVDALAQALAASGGAIDANVRAQAAQLLQDTELANGKGKLVDVMSEAGVSLGTLTNAYLGQGTTLEELQKNLQATADAHEKWATTTQGAVQGWDDEGLAAIRAKNALGAVRGELESGRKKQKELADAINQSSSTGTTSYGRLQSAVQTFSDTTQSSETRVNALKQALDALSGNTMSFHDAEAQLNAVMLQIDDTMKGNIEQADGWGKALIGNDKLVDTSTKNGQTLNTQLGQLRDNMLSVAESAKEAAEKGQLPMADAMAQSQTAMEGARKKALELAAAFGIPKGQAKALVDQMGFIPDTIQTVITANGVPEATAEIIGLRGKLEELKPGQSIHIDAPKAAETTEQLQALGFTVQRIPDKHQVVVTAPTAGARIDLAALSADIAAAPNKKDVTVQAIIDKAVTDLGKVQDKIAATKGKSITMSALTATAEQTLKTLGFKVEHVPGVNGAKKVQITAPPGTVLSNVGTIQGAINGISGKTVYVSVAARFGDGFNSDGSVHVSGMGHWANGGILKFANGGIRRATDRIKAFANGAEKHIAQIARPGEMRLWAEKETGGEAYIPLAPSKRKRSEAILEQVAEMFGGRVVYFAQGALRQYAQGGVRTRATTVRERTSVKQAAGALVGGDLNLNIGAVDSTGTALEDAMFELRRIRMGGVYG